MKISVIIPSYNRASLLPRTIESIINQTYENFEIILVDDCSQDNTLEVVQSLQEKWPTYEIRYIKHDVNKGESGARNTGTRAASGEYVAFLDSDDKWHEDKLRKQLDFLKDHSFIYDGVVCEYFLVSEAEALFRIALPEEELNAKRVCTHGSNYSIGSTLLIKRQKILTLFDENLKLFADKDWLYHMLLHCRIGVLHVPLTYYYKSPMRLGEYIEEHVAIFLSKYHDIQKSFSFIEKRRFLSTMHWYIAVAYDAHQNFSSAIYHYVKGLWLMPWKNPGNYLHVLKLCFKWMRNK